ncbi:MAG: DUF1566 domain-containing protein [Methyloprofundus sp.]|nr:DUF1566 domain-containing protein [Methyloprofundus sp.]
MRCFLSILICLFAQTGNSQALCYDLEKEIPCGGTEFPRQEGDYAVKDQTEIFKQGELGTVQELDKPLLWMGCTLGKNKQDICKNPKAMSLSAAKKRCAAIQLLNRQWRLPEVMELDALLVLNAKPPKINTQLFPDTVAAAYWTATDSVTFKSKKKAWFVHFSNASIFDAEIESKQYVRCVSDMPAE